MRRGSKILTVASLCSTWTGATVWSLWSRNKWWVLLLLFSPPFLPPFVLHFYTFEKTKDTLKLYSPHLNITSGPWDLLFLFSSTFLLFPGGWSELPTAGDLWDREQIQQPRIKGKQVTTASLWAYQKWCECVTVALWRSSQTLLKKKRFLMFQRVLSTGRWRWDQWQQRRVCGVFVGCSRHTHPAVQTPVSLQRLCRHAALPGQLLPHLQTAWV